jgi:hypothetical protein
MESRWDTRLRPAFAIIDPYSVELSRYLMKLTQGFFSIIAISSIALIGQAQSAQAFSFKMTTGAASPSGVTTKGAYSEFAGSKTVRTVDFNSGSAPTDGFAKYSFQSNNGSSSVRSNVWAPAGAKGEVNDSQYLAVFKGNDVTINLANKVNYFGIDWGAISGGNVFSFYNGDQLVQSYSTEDVNPVAPIRASQHNNEGNGFAHFYANSASEIFDRIVISQTADGGGFESDNHSFNIGTGGFDFPSGKSVPEPGMLLGLVAIGGAVWSKRKRG